MRLEHSPFSNIVPVARVQVPMAAVEFVVGYRDLVLSLVGLSPYTTELLSLEKACEQHSASWSLLLCPGWQALLSGAYYP